MVTKSKTFQWDAANGKAEVEDKDYFEAGVGERFLVSGVADTVFKGSFRMRIWVIPGAPKIDHVPQRKEDDLEKLIRL